VASNTRDRAYATAGFYCGGITMQKAQDYLKVPPDGTAGLRCGYRPRLRGSPMGSLDGLVAVGKAVQRDLVGLPDDGGAGSLEGVR
jgi:hypothetical protein